MTIPTVVKNYQKHQVEVRLKKFYTTFANAANQAVADYGPIKTWDAKLPASWYNDGLAADDFTRKFILPYIKYAKYCSRSVNRGKCTNVNRTGASQGYYNGIQSRNGESNNAVHFVLQDGTFVCVSLYAIGPALAVDINGDKGPNKLGIDVFGFHYGTFYYYPYTDFIYNRFIPNARDGCSSTGKGDYADGCTWKIMRNGWKIPDDYPW